MDKPEQTRLHFGDQVFAATMDSADSPALQLSGKHFRDRLAQRKPRQMDFSNLFPHDRLAQPSSYGFNFRHLRHFFRQLEAAEEHP